MSSNSRGKILLLYINIHSTTKCSLQMESAHFLYFSGPFAFLLWFSFKWINWALREIRRQADEGESIKVASVPTSSHSCRNCCRVSWSFRRLSWSSARWRFVLRLHSASPTIVTWTREYNQHHEDTGFSNREKGRREKTPTKAQPLKTELSTYHIQTERRRKKKKIWETGVRSQFALHWSASWLVQRPRVQPRNRKQAVHP